MKWIIKGKPHRPATEDEIKALQSLGGAPHVTFACMCGHGYWTAKNIALSNCGGYNGTRNIFYYGEGRECECPPCNLICVVVEDGQ